MKNFSKQARELLVAIQKIDSANYPEVRFHARRFDACDLCDSHFTAHEPAFSE